MLVLATSPFTLLEALIHVRTVLSRTSTLDNFANDAVEGANAHAALSVARQSIMPGKAVTALTWVRLDPRVYLGVPLEIVLPNEALFA